MNALCRKFLDTDNEATRKLLVGGLIGLVLKDNSIPSATVFDTGYKEVTRAELAQETDFILQPFLISIWGYIVTKKPNAEEGAETYMRWTEDAGGGNPRRINTRWGTNTAKKIAVSTDLPEEMLVETADEEQDSEEETKKTPADEAEAEVIDAEVVEPLETKTIVKEGRIYQQQAQKIYNIEHIENFYG